MQGQVYKIHSDFYYVKINNDAAQAQDSTGEILECKLREALKKQKQQVFVGDFVQINSGAIEKVLPRQNHIKRPSVANLDLLLVVSSIKEPALDFIQLNRYLTFAKYNKIEAALCFNKEDLEHDSYLEKEIVKIYKPLGYKIIFTSALKKTGLNALKKLAKGKTIALCGNSGVGKSSLLNALNPNFNLKIKDVSQKTERGVHTTRHVEILDFCVDGYDFKIMDTPGFSQIRFDFLLPNELSELFEDISAFSSLCKFRNCTHKPELSPEACGVIKNLDKIAETRYESYLEFLEEAKEYKEKVTYSGKKIETTSKMQGEKLAPKISNKKREASRRVQKQNVQNE